MTVSYDGLWRILQEKGLRKQNLVDDVGLSPVTVSKMGKKKLVNDKVIDRICEYAPAVIVPSYSLETYRAVTKEQAEKEHIKRCIKPELPDNHYVYSKI